MGKKSPMRAVYLQLLLGAFAAGYWYLNKKLFAILFLLGIWTLAIIGENYKGSAFEFIIIFSMLIISGIHCWILASRQQERADRLKQEAKQKQEEGRLLRLKKFEEKQKEKGLVKFGEKWGTPEQVKRWKETKLGLDQNFMQLSHFEFEEFIAKLFQKMGYSTTVTRKTGDYGVDVIAKDAKDILAIQVKQNKEGNNIGAVIVQNVLGAMRKYEANKAIIVTTSDFTVQAREQAKGAPIELWDKRILHHLVKKYFIK